jgi:DNA-binding SARP family transcriptional activator/DNA-binding beta-propeller fold protein YncE
LEFRLLGPLELEGEQGVVSLGSGKQRALLAVLLLSANELVARERLIDELWGEEPPASAAHSLEVYVSRLRKTVLDAGGDGRLATRGTGYLLRVASDELDARRFRRLVEQARGAEPTQAAALLRRALSLWHGPALADVELFGPARTAADNLEELRLVALEERIEADLALGRHRELVGELQPLVADHPFRERLRSQLMRALYRAGRQADALDAYRDARRSLDELGLEPSPELKALQRQILNHDPALHPAEIDDAAEASPRQRPRRSPLLAFALLVAVGAGALAVALAGTSRAAPRRIVGLPGSVGLFDPTRRRLIADIPTGATMGKLHTANSPILAVGLGSVWVCNADDATVVRIDPKTRRVERTLGLDGIPGAIAVGHGSVWVVLQSGKEVVQLDAFGNVARRIPLARARPPFRSVPAPVSIASGPTAIWVVHGLASVAKIDPRSGRVLHDTRGLGGALPGEVLPTDSGIWVAVAGEGQAVRLDPASGAVVARTDPVGGVAAGWSELASGAGGVWATDPDENVVWRINPTTDKADGSVAVDRYPLGVVVRNGFVWVADALGGTIDQIDPAALRVVSRTDVGGNPPRYRERARRALGRLRRSDSLRTAARVDAASVVAGAAGDLLNKGKHDSAEAS